MYHCPLTLSSPRLTQYTAYHSVASCTLLPPVAANAFSLYQARDVYNSADTVYGKTFEGENFRGCAQNSLFTGKLSRSQDKTHFPGKLSRSG